MRYSLKSQDEIFSRSFQANMNETSLKNKLTGWIPSAQDHHVMESKLQTCSPLQIVLWTTVTIVGNKQYLCNMLSNMLREMKIWTSTTSALLKELVLHPPISTCRAVCEQSLTTTIGNTKGEVLWCKILLLWFFTNNMSWISIPSWWIEAAEFSCMLCVDYNMQYIMPAYSALLYLLMNQCWAKNISK